MRPRLHGTVVLGPYELAQAPDALAALPTTHTRGKLAIRVPRRRNAAAPSKPERAASSLGSRAGERKRAEFDAGSQ
jgi:hypothetical protein